MPKKERNMTTTTMPGVPVRRRPGRPRVPGRLTLDNHSGEFGIFVKECNNCREPQILKASDFDKLMRKGFRSRRSMLMRFIEHVFSFKVE